MRIRQWFGLLFAALLVAPVAGAAQCGMMSGGGHQHDQENGHQHDQKSSKGPDQKAKRNAKKLLDDPRGRDALLEAILEDAGFTRLLVARLSETPEWRALFLEGMGGRPEISREGVVDDDSKTNSPGVAPPGQPAYRCPMHPEVVSDRAGSCPKCGMRLERVWVKPDEAGRKE